MGSKRKWLGRAAGIFLAALPFFFQPACGSDAPPVSIPAPSPTKLRAASPAEDGLVTVTGAAGAVTGGNTVRLTNLTASGAGALQALWDFLIPSARAQVATRVEVTANDDGSFTVRIAAEAGDRLSLTQIAATDGEESEATEIVVPGNSPPLSFAPTAVTVDNAGRGYAVGSTGGGTGIAAVIDLEANSVLSTFDLAVNNPRAVDYDPTNNKLVIADPTNNAVLFVDLGDPTVQNTVAVTGAQSVAVDTVSNRALVGTTDATNSVVLLNLATESVFASAAITNADNPAAVYLGSPAVDALNGQGVLVSTFDDGSSQITVKDLAVPTFTNFEVVPDSNLSGVAFVGANQAVAADASGDRVLFADLTGAVPFAALAVGDQPSAVAFDDGDDQALVTNARDHTVSVIDVNSRSVTGTEEVGLSPRGIAHFNAGDLALTANGGNDSVSILP